jgi:hypothetical protein
VVEIMASSLITSSIPNSLKLFSVILRGAPSAGRILFQEVCTQLGVETQRQWSDNAITRITPISLGLSSWITLLTHQSQPMGTIPVRRDAGYVKPMPTFSDAIALVSRQIWQY